MTRWLLILSVLVVAACAGMRTPIPDDASSEAQLYVSKCGSCHAVPHPKRHTFAQWEHWMKIMDKVMEERQLPPLTAEERSTILAYLQAHAR